MEARDKIWESLILPYEEGFDIYIDELIQNKKIGFDWGLPIFDELVGYLRPKEIHTVGAFSGTGKSYFLSNILNGMLAVKKEIRPRVLVFSTEMTQLQYLQRMVAVRLGYWLRPMEDRVRTDAAFQKEFIMAKVNLFQELRSDQDAFRIFNSIYSIEGIEKSIEDYKESVGIYPQVIAIDYIQALNVKGFRSTQEIMDEVVRRLRTIALEKNIAMLILSQVNHYSMMGEDRSDDSALPPLSNGKSLIQASTSITMLTRPVVNGKLAPVVKVHLKKSREGDTSAKYAEIKPGFRLSAIHESTYKMMIAK